MEHNIVLTYLEKQYQDLYEHKLNLEKECQKNQTKLQDTIKFIRALKKSLDDNFESFFPRKQDQESHDKIVKLEKEQKEIELELDRRNREFEKIQRDLSELELVLNEERKNTKELYDFRKCLSDCEAHYLDILDTQDRERHRIAKNLYDELIQIYDTMLHKIEICSRLVNIDTIRSHKELNDMSDFTKSSMQNMLRILFDISFIPLEKMELDHLVKEELSVLEKNGIKMLFQIEGGQIEFLPVIKLTVAKVLRESCDNIIKHAQAKNTIVKIRYDYDFMEIWIEDDGVGFDTKLLQMSQKIGVGISIIRERVFLLGGNILISSNENRGSKVYVKIPLKGWG